MTLVVEHDFERMTQEQREAILAQLAEKYEELPAKTVARRSAVTAHERLAERRARRERYRANRKRRLAEARADSLADIGYAKWKALGGLLRKTEGGADNAHREES